MHAKLCVWIIVLIAALAAFAGKPADAGIPRGAVLTADEQDADDATGVTVARGNAEISVEPQRILGRADQIELNPARNQIQLKGRAVLTVGRERYESDTVTCTLDFDKCAGEPNAQVLAAPSAAESAAAIRP